MYITPQSTVKLCSNVPFNNSYEHTTKFASKTAQLAYFAGKVKYNMTNLSCVVTDGLYTQKIRVQKTMENLYDCNYLYFQNSGYGNRWFFGFITNIKYLNNNTSEITYEIDVYNTWQFDITLKPSFVEREHTSNDTIGYNLVPENLELGEYMVSNFDGTGHMSGMKIVVASTFDSSYDDVAGGYYGGIYSGLYYNVFDDAIAVNSFIDNAVTQNKQDGIISIFMMPSDFVVGRTAPLKSYSFKKKKSYTMIDRYIPKNKKLFTYPYNFLYVTNFMGNKAEYHYELFQGDLENVEFFMAGDMSNDPQVILAPVNYKGLMGGLPNYNEKIVMNGFPQCSYNTDVYKAWLAQNGGSTAVNMLGSAVTAGAGVLTGNPVAIAGGVYGIISQLARITPTQSMPPQAHGATGGNALTAIGLKDFAFMNMSIKYENAKIIDDFFSKYGYATKLVKIPNINNRENWSFVKTIDVCILGSIPNTDLNRIKQMFNDGVTFWKNPNNMMDYTLSNEVVN